MLQHAPYHKPKPDLSKSNEFHIAIPAIRLTGVNEKKAKLCFRLLRVYLLKSFIP